MQGVGSDTWMAPTQGSDHLKGFFVRDENPTVLYFALYVTKITEEEGKAQVPVENPVEVTWV